MKNILKSVHVALALLLALGLAWGAGVSASAAELGSITLTLADADGVAVSDGALTLYQVAAVTEETEYVYTDAFSACTLTLDVEDSTLASSLAEYVEANGITGTEGAIGEDGVVTFSDLEQGLYLLVQTTESTGFYAISPVVVTVPYLEDGVWIMDVNASPKVAVAAQPTEEETPPTEEETPPTEETTTTTTTTTKKTTTTTSSKLPQTGQLTWPIPVLAAGGLVLFAAGWLLIRSDRDKRKDAA